MKGKKEGGKKEEKKRSRAGEERKGSKYSNKGEGKERGFSRKKGGKRSRVSLSKTYRKSGESCKNSGEKKKRKEGIISFKV